MRESGESGGWRGRGMCVCVCVRERERGRQGDVGGGIERGEVEEGERQVGRWGNGVGVKGRKIRKGERGGEGRRGEDSGGG